jgi:NAD(P)H-flavin reductase
MGRPDLTSKITEVVESTGEEDRTIVAACGPDSMMREVRRTVAAVVGKGERSVELHL